MKYIALLLIFAVALSACSVQDKTDDKLIDVRDGDSQPRIPDETSADTEQQASGGISDIMQTGDRKTYESAGLRYTVTAAITGTGVSFNVNGEETGVLTNGETHALSDGAVLTMLGTEGDSVKFQFVGGTGIPMPADSITTSQPVGTGDTAPEPPAVSEPADESDAAPAQDTSPDAPVQENVSPIVSEPADESDATDPDAERIVLSQEAYTVQDGEEFTITLLGQNMDYPQGFGLDAQFAYNPGMMEYKSASDSRNGILAVNPSFAENTGKIGYVTLQDISGDQELLALTFLAKNKGQTSISLHDMFINEQQLQFEDSATIVIS